MLKFLINFTLFCSCTLLAFSQDDKKNITIQNATEEYRFVKGNTVNPVQVKIKTNTTYSCNEYRTSLPVVEQYNEQIEINDVEVRINGDKLKNFRPATDYYSVDGIFYSDARIYYFSLPLDKKGAEGEVKFEKTILDPRYFTNIFFTETYFTKKKEINLVVPKWMKIEIKEYNFDGYKISKKITKNADEDIYTYTLTNAPGIEREEDAPGPTYIIPHILIMNKYAEPDGQRITYFNTLADQYGWYHQLVKQVDNDVVPLKAKAEEITKGLSADMEKVKALYKWTQENIRYIAYEDGIAGFKPDKAQEVLRKKYGDCKGMANLLTQMIRSIGLDARLCWLGTNHIAYDYSTPSLGVDNHCISAWISGGKTYFLDATEKYIGFGETAERIQGRQVLIEDGDKYMLKNIPTHDQLQNTAYEKRTLAIDGNNLVGKVVKTWKGESKEWMLQSLHGIKREKQEDALRLYLTGGNNSYQITDLKIINLDDYNKDLKIEYNLLYKDAATTFDKDIYLELDNQKSFSKIKFDTADRKLPYEFPYKDHTVYEVELQLPQGAKPAELPANLKIDSPEYSMNGTYIADKNKITYRREVMLKKTKLDPKRFINWNADITKLNEFYNTQLTVTK